MITENDIKPKGKGKLILGIILTLIIGILIGGGATYYYLDSTKEEKEETKPKEETTSKEDLFNNTFIRDKVINEDKVDNIYGYNLYTNYGIQAYVSATNKAKYTITYSPTRLNELYGLKLEDTQNDPNKYEIIELTSKKEIADIVLATFGQDVGEQDSIVLLNVDGTIEYYPIIKTFTSDTFKTTKTFPLPTKLDGVEKVIKVYSVNTYLKNSLTGGALTTLAQKADGSFYDLVDYIK